MLHLAVLLLIIGELNYKYMDVSQAGPHHISKQSQMAHEHDITQLSNAF